MDAVRLSPRTLVFAAVVALFACAERPPTPPTSRAAASAPPSPVAPFTPGVELIVSARRDGIVPALVVGLGGIWAEALGDVAVIPLPASSRRVEDALRSLRGAALLTGGRGTKSVDLQALAAAAAGIGEALLAEGLGLIEVNPLIAGPDGPCAVDAVINRG